MPEPMSPLNLDLTRFENHVLFAWPHNPNLGGVAVQVTMQNVGLLALFFGNPQLNYSTAKRLPSLQFWAKTPGGEESKIVYTTDWIVGDDEHFLVYHDRDFRNLIGLSDEIGVHWDEERRAAKVRQAEAEKIFRESTGVPFHFGGYVNADQEIVEAQYVKDMPPSIFDDHSGHVNTSIKNLPSAPMQKKLQPRPEDDNESTVVLQEHPYGEYYPPLAD